MFTKGVLPIFLLFSYLYLLRLRLPFHFPSLFRSLFRSPSPSASPYIFSLSLFIPLGPSNPNHSGGFTVDANWSTVNLFPSCILNDLYIPGTELINMLLKGGKGDEGVRGESEDERGEDVHRNQRRRLVGLERSDSDWRFE